jgi:hypothetical protein
MLSKIRQMNVPPLFEGDLGVEGQKIMKCMESFPRTYSSAKERMGKL